MDSSVHFLFRPGAYNIQRTIWIRGTQSSTHFTFEKMNNQQSEEGEVFLNYKGTKPNSPLFLVEKGMLLLRELQLSHQSSGVDLWGGNAAIHVEARNGLALLCGDRCAITSKSGRGIVVSNSGMLNLEHCNIHSCAATGIYISGRYSAAQIVSTDIVGNGNGGQGLSRGHSGICLEDGTVSVLDSNISHNSASGISLVTTDERCLEMSDSDVIHNGVMSLDLPSVGAHALSRSIVAYERKGNRLGDSGLTRPRSTLPNAWSPASYDAVFEEL